MSLSRFYLHPSAWHAEMLTLAGDEAAHCARVQRHQVGDSVEVGDGAGKVAQAQITRISKSEVHLAVTALHQHEPLPYRIHLLPALIKAEPFEWLLEKAVELGAASVQPVITERTVINLTGEQAEKKRLKWQRLMIESAKQCHTPFIPDLRGPQPFATAVQQAAAGALKVMPALSECSQTLKELPMKSVTDVYALIGPEGDFTPSEEALAQQCGFLPITLGPLVLRAETAAVAVLAILGHELRS